MEKIMVVNAGSSSLKFQLFEMPKEEVITSGIVERIGMNDSVFTIKFNGEKYSEVLDIENHGVAVKMLLEKLISSKIVDSLNEIQGVGHRVLHGGERIVQSTLVDDYVIRVIDEVKDLGPLHNPANLTGILAFKEALPNVKQVAVFDTAFHQTMKEDAFLYAVPYEWYEKYAIRKYGFHGTSHKYVSLKTAEVLGKDPKDIKVIICHIGNGASICAVDGGKCVDTSMGLTPLAGIPMGTRSGDIDPAVVEYVAKKEGLTIEQVITKLNKASGYLGISGVSSDSRDLDKCSSEGNRRCALATDLQAKRIVDFIASYYVYMSGCDALVFTAGIGENASSTRKKVVDRLGVLGIKLDEERNKTRGKIALISSDESKIPVYVIPTNEELMICRDTVELIHK